MSGRRYKVRDDVDGYQIGDSLDGVNVVLAVEYYELLVAARWAMELVKETWEGNQNMVAESEYARACQWLLDHHESASAAPEGA